MSIVRCPRCHDEVTVPHLATSRALVRCPLCLEQYLLAEALANAPPPLVIIGGEVQQSAIDISDDTAHEYQVAGGSYSAAIHAAAPATAAVTIPRPVVRTVQRPRRKEKSGLVLFVNYVVGGVMGLALGLLVLWWGFRKDPLDLGPQFAQYAPWIVPSQFHAKPEAANGAGVPTIRQPASATSGKRTPAKNVPTGLQTLPGLDEPANLPPVSVAPPIEAPAEDSKSSRPMPDLTDLLP